MRPEEEIAYILAHIKSVQLPPDPEPPPERRSILWMPPDIRRAYNLSYNGRLRRLTALSEVLAAVSGTPEWVAGMALDCIYLPGREDDLDDPNNDPPALELALMAMGLKSEGVVWARGAAH